MKHILSLLLITFLVFVFGANKQTANFVDQTQVISVAFMPDIHFHDIYGNFSDGAFAGLPTQTAQGERQASIRSMRAQLHSTRLFNENYFALLAALDDIVKRNIKYVALPGDFSDDGQPLHMRGLKTILDKYRREYGIEFFAAPGNHDPTKPISHPAGKPDFLGVGGKEQPIFSKQHPACLDQSSGTSQQLTVICSDEVQELGYQPIMDFLGEHGFYPKENYRYFETPYSDYTYSNYQYSVALQQAQFEKRHYEICHQGAGGKYKQASYSDCYQVSDSSYLVEPTPGLWLLAIDANVYQPKQHSNGNPLDAENFIGSSDAGYNRVITHKTHLLEWISDVVQRAKAQHKTLIAFSHFPMQDFYDGAAADIEKLMGEGGFQLSRKPATNTSKMLADTGLKIHVAGHMHINDTGVYRGDDGKVLFNIQAPSLAAYLPAYKILTTKANQQVKVETVVLNQVPRFDELFPHYQEEWNYLQSINAPDIWNKDILQAKNYHQFTEWHLRELSRLRFFPKEWPADIRQLLMTMNGKQMLVLSQLDADIGFADIHKMFNGDKVNKELQLAWGTAAQQAEQVARAHGLDVQDFAAWNGRDLSLDFYRLWNADQLALRDIDPQRFVHYQLLAQQFVKSGAEGPRRSYHEKLGKLLSILLQFSGDAPSDHFLLELDSGGIKQLP
ncbi:MAG: metallophosphoesterase [Cellvibrio sp.]|uniref:metallophosphoesterase n=1 Tax=Cellvibrio sp. TaxID=1965322 RepID=UPI0031B53F93